MSKPTATSTLYRLIAAGQLAHKAVLLPLVERGLEPGDDAILFMLGQSGLTDAALCEQTGLDDPTLQQRLQRLSERGLITRQAVGPDLVPGLALSERGERIRAVLAGNWEELENALFGELDKKERKKLDKSLKRFVKLLRL